MQPWWELGHIITTLTNVFIHGLGEFWHSHPRLISTSCFCSFSNCTCLELIFWPLNWPLFYSRTNKAHSAQHAHSRHPNYLVCTGILNSFCHLLWTDVTLLISISEGFGILRLTCLQPGADLQAGVRRSRGPGRRRGEMWAPMMPTGHCSPANQGCHPLHCKNFFKKQMMLYSLYTDNVQILH